MKSLLCIAAILASLFGAMLVLAPAKYHEPTGKQLTPMLAALAQAHRATLVGLGVINGELGGGFAHFLNRARRP